MKAAQGGFTVPPRKFTLHFGRATLDVHVPVGVGDRHVSRLHGVFTCDGAQWWLRNEGRLPIRMLGEEPLLCGHEMPMPAGYTPLTIETPHPRSHWIEVFVIGSSSVADDADSRASTLQSDVYDLSPAERLVITALAQRYLRQERYPQPVAWKQVADDVGRADPLQKWTVPRVEHTVANVRKRLSEGRHPVPGLMREDGIGEPVGNTLNHNLIQALLMDATLLPQDLYLLGEEVCG
ncbi:hypothetical protein OH799_05900 [Nocardia sp. NBC_00881]|uniref:hypothetical protein n=1 Tax=Nocardia sp. NBC_00881 TaxID=2975995 RepID=UPI00386BEB79|nr:hypothetical protein OH799_05900 [Nocardia sp. NBC_00881]